MALYTYKSQRDMEKMLNSPKYNPNSQIVYNAIGQDSGQRDGDNKNFFQKRGESIENALGTTGAAAVGGVNERIVNEQRDEMNKNQKAAYNDVAKKYGYNTRVDLLDAYDAAVESGDTQKANELAKGVSEINQLASGYKKEQDKFASDYKDYVQNDYIGQKTNQDRGKFLGSAMNTLSTAADVMLPGAGVAFNAAQGAWEGLADELEQNGLENFDWGRAGQNALIGAATGGVTGALNKGMSSALAKNGGNLFKGGNVLTKGLNDLGSKTAVGRGASTLATGAARGAISGAVGGATGAGLSAAMNGQDVLGSAIQGAVQGAQQGATTGGIMAGVNMAANKTPGVGNVMRQLNEAGEDWNNRKAQGQDFDQRLTETLTSGDSAVGEWVQGNRQSGALSKLRNMGGTLQDTSALVDNTGRAIPTEIAERLANIDTRLLDENGNIKVMYHGTPNGGFERPNDGTYFSENKEYADGYQNPSASSLSTKKSQNNPMTYEGYLDIKKPFTLADQDAKEIYLNEYIKGGNSQYYDPYTDYRKTIDGLDEVDWVEGENLREWLQQNHPEYDGLFLDEGGDGGYGDTEYRWRGKSVVPFSGDQFINRNNNLSAQRTPTTLGGWLKQAGKRVVEDVNNSNLGNRIKNVADQTAQTTEANINTGKSTKAGDPETEVYRAITGEKGQSNSAWDTLAQESGFNSYDDAVQQFMKANPNAEVTAENVTDFMDTTLNNNKKTFTQAKTSKMIKNERAIQEEIIDQFNPVGQPTIRATKPRETFSKLYNNMDLSDADQIRQAVHYAEPGELVPTMIREAAGRAGVVDLTDAQTLVSDLKLNKRQNYNKVLNVVEDIIDSTPSTISGGKNGVDALQLQRALEQAASDAEGSNGTYHIGSNLIDATTAKNLRRVANSIGESLDKAVIDNNGVAYVQNKYADEIQAMRNSQPNNEKWQAFVDSEIAGAKSIKQLRSSIKDLTRASIYIEDGDNRYGGIGSTTARKGADIPTSKSGMINKLLNASMDKLHNTSQARNARLARYERNMAKEADLNNAIGTQSNTNGTLPAQTTNTTTDANYNPATQLYNMIGREEGLSNAEQARTAQYLADAAQEAETVPNTSGTGANTAMDTTNGTTNTSVYNSLYGTQNASTPRFNTLEEERAVYFFPPTGDYWTDMLSQAMRNAKNAEDYDALGQLYEMYQNALTNAQKSSSTSTEQVKLTDKQRQANAAALALDQLEQLEPDAAYDLSDIPVIGGIATLGGNSYETAAKSLAQQVGYMLSGANVTKDEAENIGKAYVPLPRDNEAIRQQKLNKIRGIISEYQRTYSE